MLKFFHIQNLFKSENAHFEIIQIKKISSFLICSNLKNSFFDYPNLFISKNGSVFKFIQIQNVFIHIKKSCTYLMSRILEEPITGRMQRGC
jgi:hypothetical protein